MKISTLAISMLAVGALVLSATGAANAVGSNYWYMDSNGTITDVAPQGTPPEPSSVTIVDNADQFWTADKPAQVAVGYHADDWTYSLDLSQYVVGHFQVCVGKATDPNDFTTFTDLECASVTAGPSSQLLYTGIIAHSAMIIYPGEYLGFAIKNTQDAAQAAGTTTASKAAAKAYNTHRALVLNTGVSTTRIGSPASDPGYPTPELSTLLLAGSGLGAVGLVVARRR